jgi:hypothetical protein
VCVGGWSKKKQHQARRSGALCSVPALFFHSSFLSCVTLVVVVVVVVVVLAARSSLVRGEYATETHLVVVLH